MRRLLAITLLIAFFAPAAAPSFAALTADPEAGLLPCCRSHGAHHCALLHWMLQHRDSGAPFFSSAPCAQYPIAAAVPQLANFTLAAMLELAVPLGQRAARAAVSSRAGYRLPAFELNSRGPPHLA
ncbi:MAG TPA: hypothetical protein VN612_03070 [Acidobacteriaceae bacterium]|nr:hypothetical protein [Acidobacteriaceae bacterium]